MCLESSLGVCKGDNGVNVESGNKPNPVTRCRVSATFCCFQLPRDLRLFLKKKKKKKREENTPYIFNN